MGRICTWKSAGFCPLSLLIIIDLCNIAQPDLGLITNVGKAHLEGFGSLEGVARAKGELFDYLRINHKTLFVNDGNELVRKLVPVNYTEAVHYNGKAVPG